MIKRLGGNLVLRSDEAPAASARLERDGILNPSETEALDGEARDATERAVAFAEAGEWEPVGDLLKDVYAGERPCA